LLILPKEQQIQKFKANFWEIMEIWQKPLCNCMLCQPWKSIWPSSSK